MFFWCDLSLLCCWSWCLILWCWLCVSCVCLLVFERSGWLWMGYYWIGFGYDSEDSCLIFWVVGLVWLCRCGFFWLVLWMLFDVLVCLLCVVGCCLCGWFVLVWDGWWWWMLCLCLLVCFWKRFVRLLYCLLMCWCLWLEMIDCFLMWWVMKVVFCV